MKKTDIRCSVCGKQCNLWWKSFKDYAYKIYINHKCVVQCSYSCWMKETKRLEEEKDGRKETEC